MSIRKGIAMAVMAAVGAFNFMPAVERVGNLTTKIAPVPRKTSRQYHGAWSYPARDGWTARDGWSVATGKRMAKKSRNQARHKRAMKG